MNGYQLDRYKSYAKTLNFLEDNPGYIAPVVQIAPLHAQLKDIVKQLGENDAITISDYSGYTLSKTNARAALSTHIMLVVSWGKAYAVTSGNAALATETATKPSYLTLMREADLYVYSQKLYDTMLPHATDFAANGPAMLATLLSLKDTFLESIQASQRVHEDMKRATAAIDQLMKDAHQCRKDLEVYMATLQYTDNGLYREWRLSNGIDNRMSGRGKRKKKEKI